MKPISPKIRKELVRLLAHSTSVLGLKLCFRDNTPLGGLPDEWRLHVTPACMAHKSDREEELVCKQWTGDETNRVIAGMPKGRIQECPFGLTDLVVPVMVDGYFAGPLYAGPAWMRPGKPPHRSVVVPPSREWLEERRTLLRAIALEVARLLAGEERFRPEKRRSVILEYVRERLDAKVSLAELAKLLCLSPSRTTHLVRELFGTSLPLLARHLKLHEAARELTITDLPISEIGRRHGFNDQNYFSRIFTNFFNICPSSYRRKYASEADV